LDSQITIRPVTYTDVEGQADHIVDIVEVDGTRNQSAKFALTCYQLGDSIPSLTA
jgi:hypothetical protein